MPTKSPTKPPAKPRRPRTRPNVAHKPQSLPAKFKPGFLSALDGRTDLAKKLRTNLETIIEEQGGIENISHAKRALIERFVWLEAILQTIEHELATSDADKGVALSRWIQACNALSGICSKIGMGRGVVTDWAALTQPSPSEDAEAK